MGSAASLSGRAMLWTLECPGKELHVTNLSVPLNAHCVSRGECVRVCTISIGVKDTLVVAVSQMQCSSFGDLFLPTSVVFNGQIY